MVVIDLHELEIRYEFHASWTAASNPSPRTRQSLLRGDVRQLAAFFRGHALTHEARPSARPGAWANALRASGSDAGIRTASRPPAALPPAATPPVRFCVLDAPPVIGRRRTVGLVRQRPRFRTLQFWAPITNMLCGHPVGFRESEAIAIKMPFI